MTQGVNLGDQGRAIARDGFGCDDVRQVTVDPAPNRRLRDLELGEEASISSLESRLPDSVIIGPP